jgi:hypothetical protein
MPGKSRGRSDQLKEWTPLRPHLVAEVQYDQFSTGRFRHHTRFLRWRPVEGRDDSSVVHGDLRLFNGELGGFDTGDVRGVVQRRHLEALLDAREHRLWKTELRDELLATESGKKLLATGVYITTRLEPLINSLHKIGKRYSVSK